MVFIAAKTDQHQHTAARQTTTIATLARQTEMTGGFKIKKRKQTMSETLAKTGLMPTASDDTSEQTSLHDLSEVLSTDELLQPELAWSRDENPLPEDLDTAGLSNRILNYNPYSHELVVAPITPEQLADIEQRIAQAPNLDEAFKLVDEAYDSNPLDMVSLYEKIHAHYGNSEDATDRIDRAVAQITESAELAISGQLGSATPNDGVEGLVKAYNVASNPLLKGEILSSLEYAVQSAASNGDVGHGVYELNPEVAQGALEVIEDLRRISPKQEVDAELLLTSHKNEDVLRRQLAEIEAQRAEMLAQLDAQQADIYAQIDAERIIRAHEMPSRHPVAGVSGLLRFGTRLVS